MIANDTDLREGMIYKYHDAPVEAHLSRESLFAAVSHHFFRPHMYKWVRMRKMPAIEVIY